MSEKRQNLLIGLGICLVLAILVLGGYYLLSGKSGGVKKPPKISLIPTTPPPPPPPPKEEKKPEPPKEQKEVKEVPQAPPKEAPPAPATPDLKMDGPAGDGPSAFSSGKITSEDLSKFGTGGGGDGGGKGLFNPFTNYATMIKGELQRYLSKNKDLRQKAYKVEVHVWVAADGRLTRHDLIGSTGDSDMDEAIRQALAQMGTFTGGPPADMPMPVRLRLKAGGR